AGLGYVAINTATDWAFPDSPRAMLVVQSLYAGVLALVVFAIARRFFDARAGVIAAALVLVHPSLVYYDTRKLHPLGFDSLSMMTAVWLLLRLRDDHRPWIAVPSGIVFGLSMFPRGRIALF